MTTEEFKALREQQSRVIAEINAKRADLHLIYTDAKAMLSRLEAKEKAHQEDPANPALTGEERAALDEKIDEGRAVRKEIDRLEEEYHRLDSVLFGTTEETP